MDNLNKASFTIPREELFAQWLILTKPMHQLSKVNIKVLTEILKARERLSTKIIDNELLDKVLFSTESRQEIMALLDNMEAERFNNILSDLRRNKVIIDNKLNPIFIPNIKPNAKAYRLLFELKFE